MYMYIYNIYDVYIYIYIICICIYIIFMMYIYIYKYIYIYIYIIFMMISKTLNFWCKARNFEFNLKKINCCMLFFLTKKLFRLLITLFILRFCVQNLSSNFLKSALFSVTNKSHVLCNRFSLSPIPSLILLSSLSLYDSDEKDS